MCCRPQWYSLPYLLAGEHAPHLQPTVQEMLIGRLFDKTVVTVLLFHRPKPAKKEKEIPHANALVGQMALRRPILPKKRSPPWQSRTKGGIEIRVKMGARLAPKPSTGQRFDQVAQRVFAPPQIMVSHGAHWIRNRQ